MIKRALTMMLPLGLALGGTVAQAVPQIPEDSGWSGHVNLGVGVGSSESNMLASIGPADLGDDTISSLDEDAGSEDFALPFVQFELSYTLGETRTQFYLANQGGEFLNFDMETTLEAHAGVRQAISGIGRFDFSLLSTTIPTDVWEDPYQTGVARDDTERTNTGIRWAWDGIMDSNFGVEFSAKEIEIDDERAGESLALTDDERRMLRREGNVNRFNVAYNWTINEHHSLTPVLGYADFDLDGDAMAEDGLALHLKHMYNPGGRWRLASMIAYEDLESDDTNPIYGDEAETESFGVSATFFYDNPLGLEKWTANLSASYFDEDSNIDFYDASFGMVSIGLFRRFD